MVSPLFYLMAAAMVLMALASYRYNKILFLVEGTAAVLSGLAVLVSDVLYRRNISTTVRSAKRVLTGEEEAAFQAFALPVAVVAPAGDIVWANEAFAGSLCGGRNFLGDNVLKYIYPKTFRQVMGERGTSVSHNGREYTVYGARAKEGYIPTLWTTPILRPSARSTGSAGPWCAWPPLTTGRNWSATALAGTTPALWARWTR